MKKDNNSHHPIISLLGLIIGLLSAFLGHLAVRRYFPNSSNTQELLISREFIIAGAFLGLIGIFIFLLIQSWLEERKKK